MSVGVGRKTMLGCSVEVDWLLFVDGEAWDEASLVGGLWGTFLILRLATSSIIRNISISFFHQDGNSEFALWVAILIFSLLGDSLARALP
jgi:hypothetical protein